MSGPNVALKGVVRWVALRFALRELRSGVKGFRIFLACLALGVAAIAAASSTAEAFRQGLAGQAREILGGDLAVSVEDRDFTPAERARLAATGRLAYAAAARAMAQAPTGDRRLVELRGVDGAYPLAGTVQVSGAPSMAAALTPDGDGVPGAAVEGTLLDRLEYFLGFIGLASLLAGGLGVFGAVSAYLETRKESIAVLKALGAEGPLIRDVYLIQVGVLALIGVAIGLAIGAATPLLLGLISKDQLPIPALFGVYPWPLAKAALFGLLSAAAFSLEPLARARSTPPASLFRRDLAGRAGFGPETVGAVLAGLGLAGLTVATAPTPVMALGMIAGVAVALGLLWVLGRVAVVIAARVRGGTRGSLRLGLANLAGPRSAARTATPAIGLGVGLLSAVVLIQSSLLAEVRTAAPKSAPAVVFTEIPADRAGAFDAEVARAMGPLTADRYLRAPMASGRITALKGRPVERKSIPVGQRWAFDNDISLSALGPEPANGGIVAGHWWPATYAGPPLVAIEQQIAAAGGLKIGDAITLSLLGRDIEARVAVIRKVDWGGFGPSFEVIIDPAAVAGAQLRNVAIARTSRASEAEATRDLGRDFPGVNVISVREALEAAAALFDRLALAIRGAAAVAGLAGLLVLAGSIAAGAGARAREAAVLKVLGAGSGQILAAYVVEYGAVGLIAGLAGVGLGAAAAWPVVVKLFEASWSVDWSGVAALIGAAAGLTGLGGLIAALQALSRRPAPVLRGD